MLTSAALNRHITGPTTHESTQISGEHYNNHSSTATSPSAKSSEAMMKPNGHVRLVVILEEK